MSTARSSHRTFPAGLGWAAGTVIGALFVLPGTALGQEREAQGPKKARPPIAKAEPRPAPNIALREAGGAMVSEQGDLLVRIPSSLGSGFVEMVFADGASVRVAPGSRLGILSPNGRESTTAALDVPVAQEGPQQAWFSGAFPSGDISVEVRPRTVETALVLRDLSGLGKNGVIGESKDAIVFFEERVVLPETWTVSNLGDRRSDMRGFVRLVERLSIVDERGDLRCSIEYPVIREGTNPRPVAKTLAAARLENGVVTVRVGVSVAWLTDPARQFPIVFDPTLTVNTPVTLTTSPDTLTIVPGAGWNAVALGHAAGVDWDIQFGAAVSDLPAGLTDYVVANGNLPPAITPLTGDVLRFSATGDALAEHTTPSGAALVPGVDEGRAFDPAAVIRLYEINVTTPSSQELTVTGVTGIFCSIFAPGTDSGWLARADSVAEFPPASPVGIIFNEPGVWVLAIYRASGATPSGTTINFDWTSSPVINLTANVGATATAPVADLSITPGTSWNTVAVFADDWDIVFGPGFSGAGGAITDFVIADGNQDPVTPTVGTTFQFSGAATAAVQHSTPTGGAIIPGVDTDRPWDPANDTTRVYEINVLATGMQTLQVTGVTGILCRVYAPAVDATWTSRTTSAVGPFAENVVTNIDFTSTGIWAIAVSRAGAAATVGTTLTFDWGGVAPLTLTANTTATAMTTPTTAFTLTPVQGFWNAVSVSADNWDITLGTGTSALTGGMNDFVVADGNVGSVAPSLGTVTMVSGAVTAEVEHAEPTGVGGPLTPGTAATRPWNDGTDICRIFEITVTSTTGTRSLTVTGVSNVRCAIFDPGATGDWMSRATAVQEFDAGTTATIDFGNPGVTQFWAIAVFRVGTAPAVGTTLDFNWNAPAPAPTLTAISPTNVVAGSAAFLLTCTGTDFTMNSVIRLDGVDKTPTTFIGATEIRATIPAADVATSGTRAITVFTPAPGGGLSTAQTLTVDPAPPAPTITTISPTNVTAGAAAFTLTVNGTGFQQGAQASVVNLGGVAKTTTFVSSTQLTASIPASDVTTAGTRAITVVTPAPGGGTSNTVNLTVDPAPPTPTLTSISPDTVTAGSGAFTLTVNGTGFQQGAQASVVNLGGVAKTTTFVSSTQLTASIPASDVTTAGTRSITVVTPAPGGGTSNALTLTVSPVQTPTPTLTSINPNTVVAGSGAFTLNLTGTGFTAASVVRVNGADRTTMFLSASELSASIPASDVAAAGTLSITVFTTGGGTSNSLQLTVTSAAAPAPFVPRGGGGGGCALGSDTAGSNGIVPLAVLLMGLLTMVRRRLSVRRA